MSLMTVPPHCAGSYWASGALRLLLIGSRAVGRHHHLLACGYGLTVRARERETELSSAEQEKEKIALGN